MMNIYARSEEAAVVRKYLKIEIDDRKLEITTWIDKEDVGLIHVMIEDDKVLTLEDRDEDGLSGEVLMDRIESLIDRELTNLEYQILEELTF